MKTMKTYTYRILVVCSCLMVLVLGGCVKNEFKVDFEFPKDHIGNYLMKYYAWDSRGGRWMEHTASIQEGVASADGITRLPTIIYVSDASHPGNSMMLYVERGDKIRISGEGNDMISWSVTGNKLSERWNEWRKGAYPKKKDRKAFEHSIEDYVKGNPKDELSAILLLTEWDRRENPEGFVRLWNIVDKSSRGQRLIDMCGVTDLLGVEFITNAEGNLEYAKDAKADRLSLRSRDNGMDTLKFNMPSLLYFYAETNTARRETVDSLKILIKEYPDSAKRVIADIYMDSDSTTWASAIRRDSLDGVVRAWQPRGVAEEDMANLGIVRLPWYIVKDKTAKETYAGSDLQEAMSAFRKLAGKPDPKASKPDTEKVKDKEKDDSKEKDKTKSESKPAQPSKPKVSPVKKHRPLAKPSNDSRLIQQSDR